jgi:hypothetical protein
MQPRQLLVGLLAISMACAGGGASELGSPCDVASVELVAASFTGQVSDGVEGVARNCTYEIEGGEVLSVDVFYYGTDDGWDGTRSGFESNRGGTTDVEGIGDEAFYPNDAGPRELVVRSGGQIYSVTVFNALAEPPPAAVEGVSSLAAAIADQLG